MGYYNAFLLSGPLLTLGGAFTLARAAFRRMRGTPSPPNLRSQLGVAAGALFIGVAHLVGIYSSVLQDLSFHEIEVNDVNAIDAQAVREEDGPPSGPVATIRDAAAIGKLLDELPRARVRHRNHEQFLDGVRLHLILGHPARRNFYITIYGRSSRPDAAGAVVIQAASAALSINDRGSEYTCDACNAWVRDVVSPAMKTKPGSPS